MASVEDVRKIALSLSQANEHVHFDAVSFQVGSKIFCTLNTTDLRLTLKLDTEDQHNLVAVHPKIVAAVEGYWGRKGWTQIRFSDLSPTKLEQYVRMAWMRVAPKRLTRPGP